MSQGKPQLNFERNLCIKFRDNCDTDGRQMTDKLRFELCWHSQAELKKVIHIICRSKIEKFELFYYIMLFQIKNI